jgi:flagellar biosynthesis/type III secretory pathway chaperone
MTTLPQPLCIQLRDHLDVEIGLHRRLLALAETKGREIVACNIPAFTLLLQQEQGPLLEMNRLRQVRERLMRQLCTASGTPNERMTMTVLITAVPELMQGELRRRQDDLTQLLATLREVNQRNMVLIQQSLTFVRSMLHGLVGDKPAQGHAYDRRGFTGAGLPGNGRLVNLRG